MNDLTSYFEEAELNKLPQRFMDALDPELDADTIKKLHINYNYLYKYKSNEKPETRSKPKETPEDSKSDISLGTIIRKVLTHIETIISIEETLNPRVYINEFTDKYGNVYLQARTAIKKEGKQRWINAYIGNKESYKGIHDPEALKKGKILIRQKLKKLNIIKL